ncbi:MAG: 2-oxoglutarate dehydrogenase E1 component [Phycisphaerales bacterium]|nr:2-oxoglutarate dehydrogenase E1 component [Phycisphaerales bacterium]
MSTPINAVSPAVNGWNADYLQQQYEAFKQDPGSIPPDLRSFFQGFDLALSGAPVPSGAAGDGVPQLQYAVDELTNAYREQGHQGARLDPLNRAPNRPARLDPAAYSISSADLSKVVRTGVMAGRASATVGEIVDHLERVYCGSIGVEFTHIPDPHERLWFLAQFEQRAAFPALTVEDRTLILKQLASAESFDGFLGKRYQGKKRFSLEGGESLIPFLQWLAQRAGELGTEEIILGMAHRGRLSVLRNFLGKDLHKLFTEFEDAWLEEALNGGGDVKYHRGYSGDQPLRDGKGSIHLSLLNNPSHLESVNPIVMGRTRAKQDRENDTERQRFMSLLIHGDAALAGQGIVAECLTMSQLDGYRVGGTIHVVINNQVGFTTDPRDARSTQYCTDIAKMVNCPVLHVNADDLDAVVASARLAADYRQKFRKDVFVDLVCFRRYGHNEQDEPTYTQPRLYASVKQHPGTFTVYSNRMIEAGVVDRASVDAMLKREFDELDAGQAAAHGKPVNPVPPPGQGNWKGLNATYSLKSPKTAISAATLAKLCNALGTAPEGFNLNTKLKGLLLARANLPTSKNLSHADAELLAIGALLLDGFPVRLSGQDCRRGTFTQRHAVLRDEKTDERYTPLNNIQPGKQAMLDVWDSPLSEFGVMGFDYGYSRGAPGCLTMWEGQFGDFVNGAQVMIDQYIASSEVKWQRWAGLVLLLPHGYEGQGPEHSSARLERFLQLCADHNMEVCYPSTGAQHFHMLRRQMMRDFRKPLIVMTPKKYLRAETSSVDDLINAEFRHLIDDPTIGKAPKNIKRVIYCSGKIYHELHERRTLSKRDDVAIVRVEQLYPLNVHMLKDIDSRYPASAERVWVQEEPRNQGAYLYAMDSFAQTAGITLKYIGRPPSASPAGGSEYAHKKTQEKILTEAIAPAPAAPAGAPAAATAAAAPIAAKSNGHATPASTKSPSTKR